jgi:hypothetical protein
MCPAVNEPSGTRLTISSSYCPAVAADRRVNLERVRVDDGRQRDAPARGVHNGDVEIGARRRRRDIDDGKHVGMDARLRERERHEAEECYQPRELTHDASLTEGYVDYDTSIR